MRPVYIPDAEYVQAPYAPVDLAAGEFPKQSQTSNQHVVAGSLLNNKHGALDKFCISWYQSFIRLMSLNIFFNFRKSSGRIYVG